MHTCMKNAHVALVYTSVIMMSSWLVASKDLASFKIQLFVRGCHMYWTPQLGETLSLDSLREVQELEHILLYFFNGKSLMVNTVEPLIADSLKCGHHIYPDTSAQSQTHTTINWYKSTPGFWTFPCSVLQP